MQKGYTCLITFVLTLIYSQISLSANIEHFRLAPTIIVDASGFEKPMVAATLFSPYGWQTRGGIVWGNQYACTNGYALNWVAQSDDELEALAILPQQGWEWNSQGQVGKFGCSLAQIESVNAYIQAILPEVFPNARIIEMRPRPDIESELANLNGESHTAFQSVVNQVESAEVLVEFMKHGITMRGILTVGVLFTRIRTGGSEYGVALHNMSGFALPSFSAYGPADDFNPLFYEAIRKSIIANPAWETRISQHNLTMGRIEREGIMQRAQIHNQTMNEISAMRQQAWQSQQKSADYRAREFVESIRDVETYDDDWAAGGQVELSSFYNNAWRLDDGSYVLSNNDDFQPFRDLGLNGQPLSVSN